MNVVALTAAERDAVIEQLLAKLCAHYVFPDRAETLTLWVRGKQEAGGYDDITDATALCERLTAHMQEITSDQHRRLVVSVGGTPAIAEGKPTPPGIEEQKARAAIGNFGFYRVERLPGNIGYLDLRGFCPAEWAGDTGDKPVYVLTSSFTFSAAEEFAYTLQQLKRATIVGERTRGGAHPERIFHLIGQLEAWIPTGRAINPVSGTNWEGVGVEPDMEVPVERALHIAHTEALRTVLERRKDDESVASVALRAERKDRRRSMLSGGTMRFGDRRHSELKLRFRMGWYRRACPGARPHPRSRTQRRCHRDR